jgi:hypothetical protein
LHFFKVENISVYIIMATKKQIMFQCKYSNKAPWMTISNLPVNSSLKKGPRTSFKPSFLRSDTQVSLSHALFFGQLCRGSSCSNALLLREHDPVPSHGYCFGTWLGQVSRVYPSNQGVTHLPDLVWDTPVLAVVLGLGRGRRVLCLLGAEGKNFGLF